MEALIAAVIAEGVVIVGLAVALIIAIKKNGRPGSKADNVRIIDGVRYTTDKLEYWASMALVKPMAPSSSLRSAMYPGLPTGKH